MLPAVPAIFGNGEIVELTMMESAQLHLVDVRTETWMEPWMDSWMENVARVAVVDVSLFFRWACLGASSLSLVRTQVSEKFPDLRLHLHLSTTSTSKPGLT